MSTGDSDRVEQLRAQLAHAQRVVAVSVGQDDWADNVAHRNLLQTLLDEELAADVERA